MGDVLKKVQPGDTLRIPAATFNTFIDAARDFRSRQQTSHQNAQPGFRQSGIVLVKNASGSDRGRFNVLGIDSPIFTPTDNEEEFKNKVALSCVTPAAAGHTGKFVILMEPIANNEIGLACVHGVCPVKINITDEDQQYADISNGETDKLKSSCTGAAHILWAEPGTGEKWAIVRLGVPEAGAILVKITGSSAIAAANNGPGSTTTEWTYSGTQVKASTSGGYQGWTAITGGLTFTDKLFNRMEYGNRIIGASGTFRNGVKFDDLDDNDWTGQLLPIQSTCVVAVQTFTDSESNVYGTFESPNGITGSCD